MLIIWLKYEKSRVVNIPFHSYSIDRYEKVEKQNIPIYSNLCSGMKKAKNRTYLSILIRAQV